VAGQAQTYVLQAGEKREENERWFTISSAPVEKTHQYFDAEYLPSKKVQTESAQHM
jgi:hypothetical protein